MPATEKDEHKLKQWQRITATTLFVGYAGYYFCRSNLSLASPYLLTEYGSSGFDKEKLGWIVTIGTGFYASGKLVNGVLGDYFGGRRIFLLGMIASIAATIFFGTATGFAMFVVAWSLNRFVQSMGWGALVKIASRWFAFRSYGTVMAFLSLSFYFGDFIARQVLGGLLKAGVGWRNMFFSSAGILMVIAIGTFFVLKSSPKDLNLEEPPTNPANLFGEQTAEAKKTLLQLLAPFFTNLSFWIVLVLSFGLTLIRETFNAWTPMFLHEVAGLAEADAATYSSYFPLYCGISVIVAGLVTDRLLNRKRGPYLAISLALLAMTLFYMSTGAQSPAMITVVGLLLGGPYSFLAGAIALDVGGKSGSATAAGLIDGAGYLGGMLAGWTFAKMVSSLGWSTAFLSLSIIAFVTFLAALAYWLKGERRG